MIMFMVYSFYLCFMAYILGIVVGEAKSSRYWCDKWWELHEEYMSEYPESFEDDPEDEEDECDGE